MNLNDIEKHGWIADVEAAREVLFHESPGHDDPPWIARIAIGIGAWIGGLFLAAFLFVALESTLKSGYAAVAAGGITVAVSVFLQSLKRGIFLQQLGLAWNFAGTVVLLFGVHRVAVPIHSDDYTVPLLVCAFGLSPLVYWFSKDPVQRFLSVFWIWLLCLATGLGNEDTLVLSIGVGAAFLFFFAGACGWLSQKLWRPASWAGLAGLLLFLLTFSAEWWHREQFLSRALFFSKLFLPLGFAVLIWIVCRPARVGAMVRVVLFGAVLLAIGWAGAVGVASSMGLMAIAHARRERLLEYFSIVFLGVFLILFYYFLGVSLLTKSLWMIGIGIVLLVFALIYKRSSSHGNAPHLSRTI